MTYQMTPAHNFIYKQIISMIAKPAKILPEKILGKKQPANTTSFTDKDAIIYSLGIGFCQDPLKEADFKYTYELSQQFIPFPTMAVTINKFDLVSPFMGSPDFPQFSPFMILHAQQRLELIKPKLIPGAQYTHVQELVDVADKGKNAILTARINSYVKNNQGKDQLAFYNDMSILIKGLGGFGYKGKNIMKVLPAIPKRNPDHLLKAVSFPSQAWLYRLTGDINPLHVDPSISSIQNFDRPILHGLASYGIAAKVLVQQLLGNNPQKLKAYQARFVGHVFPGQTLNVSVWRQGTNLIFQATVAERQTKCLVGCLQVKQQAKL